ncbi:hypothetical protein BDP81DRAFT_425608 [Colletotrichum phormii]|uniref:Transmembrane protein n=1 Tax=Colletotrichum phormii TaxID=359342 RepID=A0AAJ0EG17_9PEZI|nr:uncharacterized protein BDP81DRAFT_425608 [Colletotrichum phormii]KAK1637628.1 hypothetical protein BDP81DRAFT_425608 [Colletotrichum phormii]
MWDWQPYVTGSIIRSVLSGLVILPALGFSVLVLRKPGAKHDHTRRWVDFTKVALGLWSISSLLSLVYWIILAVSYSRRQNGGYFPYPAGIDYLIYVGGLIGYLGNVALLLAFFSLAHALTQLRSGAESDDSKAYHVGKKVVLGLSALITLVAVAIFACIVAAAVLLEILPGRDRYVPGDWDNAMRLGFAAEYMGVINIGFLLVAALGLAGYAFVSFKASRGSPTQTAATLLLIAVSLWLITRLWNFISCIMAVTGYYWVYGPSYIAAAVIDAILSVWPSFAALMILYVLASNNAYSLSRLHYQEEDDEQRVWDERTQST